MTELNHTVQPKKIEDLVHLYQRGKLELSPGFQRDSVWSERDRAKLIDSILRKWPIPAVFLYKGYTEGESRYYVIDGKQRIESILRFVGEIRGGRFGTKFQFANGDNPEWVDWRTLKSTHRQRLIMDYTLNVVEVDGDLGEIIDLFVRINSTGKSLSAAEKRHARFYNSAFLREAGKIAMRWEPYFRETGVLSAGQVSRMKHVELISELMVSVHQGDVINKKAAVDRVMSANDLTAAKTRQASAKVVKTLNLVRTMFPDLHTMRFHQLSDFYSLAVLISKLEAERFILTDRRRNALAQDLLRSFGVGVDDLGEKQKSLGVTGDTADFYREYLLTVRENTDEISRRQRRERILRSVLENVFRRKDQERLFSPEQRRILWGTADERRCSICRKPVTWGDLQIDHIKPHSKGGRTDLNNAALAHGSCNASKGARRR